MTVLDVPFISDKWYRSLENIFSENLHLAFLNQLKENGKNEKALAVELGQIDSDGIPWTDVIGDGQWSQRSYNQQGKALSGSAVLIGTLTKKPLYVGVKNKICYVCKTQPGKEHTCFKNHPGSSSGMESSLIKEGFEQSLPMHGLRYKRFIGDGDSSVFLNIKDVYLSDPSYFSAVQKITCKLHAIRAMNRNLLKAQSNSNRNSGFPKEFRDILSEKIYLFGKYANYLILRHIELRPVTGPETLSSDIKALPRHIFGLHDDCSVHMCQSGNIIVPAAFQNSRKSTNAKCKIPPRRFFESTLWTELCDICKRLSDLSTSLIHNMNTNIAESFQAHVNKFTQGRRCNNVMRGGYNRKVEEATFSFMFGPSWYVNLYKIIKFDQSPLPIWNKEQKIGEKLKSYLALKTKPKRRRHAPLGNSCIPQFFSRTRKLDGDKDYGSHVQKEDLDQMEVDFRIQEFLAKKEVDSKEEQWNVHLETIGQHSNTTYLEIRRGLITASVIGDIMGLRDSTSNVNIIDKILHPTDLSCQLAIRWGLSNELKARSLYELQNNVSVDDAGLFISLDFTALAASPDGLIGEDGILEVKCPYIERYSKPECVANRKKNAYICATKTNEGTIYSLKNTCHYYLQVVQQLHITQRKWCDFVIWTQGSLSEEREGSSFPVKPEGHILCIRIFKDSETSKRFDQIMEKSQQFFDEDLGPEIVDSRLERNMGYRQPDYRLLAIAELKERKNKSNKNKN